MSAVAPTRRIDRGRGHSYLLDGEPADGITESLSNGYPKPALIGWAGNETAGYAVDNWDELAEMPISKRLAVLQKARYLNRDKAAVRGTDVHALAVRLAAGEEIDVPEHLLGHVDAYLKFTEDWQPKEMLVEAVVGNRQWRYMGTLDVIAMLGDEDFWLLDWKTTQSGIFPESALQLSAYRRAEFYLDSQGREQAMPKVDRTGCVWLRADGYDLIPVDTSDDVFRTFLYVQQVARFAKQPREIVIGEALQPPTERGQ